MNFLKKLLFIHISLVHQSYKGHIKLFCFIKAYPIGELRDKQPTCLQPIQLILEGQKNEGKILSILCLFSIYIVWIFGLILLRNFSFNLLFFTNTHMFSVL